MRYFLGIILCTLATILWGGMFPIMTDVLKHVDAINFTTLRYTSAGVVFIALLLAIEERQGFNLKGDNIKLAWFFGSCGFSGFGFLVFWGQHMAGETGALTTSIMMATMPLLGVIVIWMIKSVKPAISTVIFILISFFGVTLVITKGDYSTLLSNKQTIISSVIIILGALCWVLYTIGGSFFPNWSVVKYTTITTILGLTTVYIINMFLIAIGFINIPNLSDVIYVIPHLGYMAFLAGAVAVLAWNMGNKILGSTNGVLFMDVVPTTAFTVSIIIGIIPSNIQIAGAITTAISLIINNINQRKLVKRK